MKESDLSRALVKVLRAGMPDGVVFKHADTITAGIPDISVTWHGVTSWLEIKHAHPSIIDRGIQALTLKQLGAAGRAHYVIYYETKTLGKRTIVCVPYDVRAYELKDLPFAEGFDHVYVLNAVKRIHQ